MLSTVGFEDMSLCLPDTSAVMASERLLLQRRWGWRRLVMVSASVAADMPMVTLVVTPEAASHARVSTSSSIETSPPTLSSQMSSQSSNLTNAFYAESSACIKKATSSVVKKKAENINFCDSAQVKSECLKYTKTAAEVPIDQQTQILFLLRKFNTSAITFAFYMLIGKVGGAAPTAFIPTKLLCAPSK